MLASLEVHTRFWLIKASSVILHWLCAWPRICWHSTASTKHLIIDRFYWGTTDNYWWQQILHHMLIVVTRIFSCWLLYAYSLVSPGYCSPITQQWWADNIPFLLLSGSTAINMNVVWLHRISHQNNKKSAMTSSPTRWSWMVPASATLRPPSALGMRGASTPGVSRTNTGGLWYTCTSKRSRRNTRKCLIAAAQMGQVYRI